MQVALLLHIVGIGQWSYEPGKFLGLCERARTRKFLTYDRAPRDFRSHVLEIRGRGIELLKTRGVIVHAFRDDGQEEMCACHSENLMVVFVESQSLLERALSFVIPAMVKIQKSQRTKGSCATVWFLQAGREHRNGLLLLAIANQSRTIFA